MEKNCIVSTFDELEKCCTGCSACVSVCPVNALQMSRDENGVFYPKINDECIGCGRCVSVCSSVTDGCFNNTIQYIGATCKNQEEIKYSASGGIFYQLAKKCIEKNGVVFGAELVHNNVSHIKIDQVDQIHRMCGSKYLQSDMGDCFRQVKKLLLNNIPTLFSGTPCQIAGLLNYLKGYKLDNLTTIELLCHGVPGNRVFNEYYFALESKYKTIEEYRFRDRRFGMSGSNVYVKFASGCEKFNDIEINGYDKLYSRGYLMRESCYRCKYSRKERIADITVGDFWGIEKVNPNWNTENGASIILCNTSKGLLKIDEIKSDLMWFETDIDSCMQESIVRPVSRPRDYNFFWWLYNKIGYLKTSKLFVGSGILSRIYKVVRRVIF